MAGARASARAISSAADIQARANGPRRSFRITELGIIDKRRFQYPSYKHGFGPDAIEAIQTLGSKQATVGASGWLLQPAAALAPAGGSGRGNG